MGCSVPARSAPPARDPPPPAHMPMSGRNAWPQWFDREDGVEAPRDHVVVENRHDPDTIHLRTLVEERYKLTVYYGQNTPFPVDTNQPRRI